MNIPIDKNVSQESYDERLPFMHEARSNRTILIFDPDADKESELAGQIEKFGYVVIQFCEWHELSDRILKNAPQAIILDYDYFLKNGIEINLNNCSNDASIIFISHKEDLETRLKAVRLGGKSYFIKPADMGAVIDVLDAITVKESQEPYRILIVDDDRITATGVSGALRKAGMKTEVVTRALDIMNPLLEFNPDLILLDVNMPECNGTELAAVIRQMERFTSTPIVYLSVVDDKDEQLNAISIGGDDFVNKTILSKTDRLIKTVSARVERYRRLRKLMLHDGLTGLLNHTTTKERLSQELERAKRENKPISFVMLDLDRFKSINDTYGHSTGDRVLKSLARFLRQRLRKSDTVGRFGGEEFAIILPNTEPKQAQKLMEELRINFALVKHQFESSEFLVTFSCGIAGYPGFTEASQINDQADKALYEAKRNGRNQVVIS